MGTHKTIRSAAFTTPVIRGAYFFLHEQRTKDGNGKLLDRPRYEFTGLLPKSHIDPQQDKNYMLFANNLMSAVSQVPEWGGQFPAGGNWPISDGDDPSKLAKAPWRKGNWVIKFSSNFPPKVAVMQNGQMVEIPARRVGMNDLYKSGDFCIVSTYSFTYDEKSKGAKFDIEGVLFVGPGEAIGMAHRTADQMFAGVVPAGTMPALPTSGAVPNMAPVAPIAPAMPGLAPVYTPPMTYPSSAPMPGAVAPQYASPTLTTPSAPGLPPFPGR